MKIVINDCHGGFGLSQQAVERYLALKNIKVYPEPDGFGSRVFGMKNWLVEPGDQRVADVTAEGWNKMTLEERQSHNERCSAQVFYDRDVPRDDPLLIETIDELGELADGDFARLKIVEVPDDANWYIEEYDGLEWVAERHRTWR
jgi:hypothetical protein